VLGFLAVSTDVLPHDWGDVVEFQSRAGFSGRLDNPFVLVFDHFSRFNPVLGFLAVSTWCVGYAISVPWMVSIPCWVFWPSRLVNHPEILIGQRRFNPVLGFLAVSTLLSGTPPSGSSPFQSRAGFSGRLDLSGTREVERRIDEFQSRAGFSGRLDPPHPLHRRGGPGVSIPCWVFWPSRRDDTGARRPGGRRFNPVLGFLAVSTSRDVAGL